jgi:ribosomal protein L14E/L6E/L27E
VPELELLSKKHHKSEFFYRKAADAYNLTAKWEALSASKKLVNRAKRDSLTDFDRFKVMINRKNKSFKVRQLAAKAVAKK